MQQRKNIVAGNWKMNLNFETGKQLIQDILSAKPHIASHQEVIIGVPYILLSEAANLTKDYPQIHIAAQDCHQESSGAYTGNISADMIASTGASHVILGHSERRSYHNEDAEILNKKIEQALNAGLKVIFCVGEPLKVRENESHNQYITEQLAQTLFQLSPDLIHNFTIAYEPIWAIGTGKTASSKQAQEMHQHIREEVAKAFDQKTADEICILYGGSCNASNAKELFEQKDVDGGLIGGASLKAEDFKAIIESV